MSHNSSQPLAVVLLKLMFYYGVSDLPSGRHCSAATSVDTAAPLSMSVNSFWLFSLKRGEKVRSGLSRQDRCTDLRQFKSLCSLNEKGENIFHHRGFTDESSGAGSKLEQL